MSDVLSFGGIVLLQDTYSNTDTLDAAVITTTETAFAGVVSLDASIIGANTAYRITHVFQVVGSGSPPTTRLRMRVQKSGPTNVYFYDPLGITGTTTVATTQVFVTHLRGTAAPGAAVSVDFGVLPGTLSGFNRNIITQPPTVDTASAQTIQATMTYGAGTAGNTVTLRRIIVERFAL